MTLSENTLSNLEIQKKAELVRNQETSESEVTRRKISRKLRVPPVGGKLSWVRVKQNSGSNPISAHCQLELVLEVSRSTCLTFLSLRCPICKTRTMTCISQGEDCTRCEWKVPLPKHSVQGIYGQSQDSGGDEKIALSWNQAWDQREKEMHEGQNRNGSD